MTILHPTVIAKLGARDRRAPAFLSREQFKCPRCGRIEYGNVKQDRVVMCSLCTMGLCMGKRENAEPKANQEAEGPKPRIIQWSRPERNCERCGESFRGKSNRQIFCDNCQKAARNDKTRKRMARMRKQANGKSVVTI